AEDGIRDRTVTGVQTCALPIFAIELSPALLQPAAGHTGGGGQARRILAGFENHGGRTTLGAGARALGRVLKGHGNDGSSGLEGRSEERRVGKEGRSRWWAAAGR